MGCVLPQIFSAPSGKTMSAAKTFWRYKNGTDLLYRLAEYGGLGLHPAGGKKVWCVFCLSVSCLKGKVCEYDFVIRSFELRNDLDILDGGRFVDVNSRSTLCLRR